MLEPWRWQFFSQLDGVNVQCIAEDNGGTIWFGTEEGVIHYDGLHWTKFGEEDGLYGTFVTTLCVTKYGEVFAGTEKGISKYHEGTWIRFFPKSDINWPINSIKQFSNGTLWAGTDWGALNFKGENTFLYTSEEMMVVSRNLEHSLNVIPVSEEVVPQYWYGDGCGLQLVPDHVATRGTRTVAAVASFGPGKRAGIEPGDLILDVNGSKNNWESLYQVSSGLPLVLTLKRKGIAEPFEVSIKPERVGENSRPFQVYDIYQDREGFVWIGLSGGNLLRSDTNQTGKDGVLTWRLFTGRDGLDIGYRPKIIQTQDEKIWTVSSQNLRGVNIYDENSWKSFKLRNQGGTDINLSILETRDGTLWIGGSEIIHSLRNGIVTVYRQPNIPYIGERVYDLKEAHDGAIWGIVRGGKPFRVDYGTTRWTTYDGLEFECDTQDGTEWFISQDNGVVSHKGQNWMRYDEIDGLMNAPSVLIVDKSGVLWAGGSQDSLASTASFDGQRWTRELHPQLSWGIKRQTAYASSDGSIWFGAEYDGNQYQSSGVIQFNGKKWIYHKEAPTYPSGIGESRDGNIWCGGYFGLRYYHNGTWGPPQKEERLATSAIETVYTDRSGYLWVGTRDYGIFCYDGQIWNHYGIKDGLNNERILSIIQAQDGTLLATSNEGINRFDGKTWVSKPLHPDLRQINSGIRQSHDGALWANLNGERNGWDRRARPNTNSSDKVYRLRTVRYEFEMDSPETEIIEYSGTVPASGDMTLVWRALDPWNVTPADRLYYSYRMDGEDWSPFSRETYKIFRAPHGGNHTFEVKSRDEDFNEDLTPAGVQFTVSTPFWKQLWFIGIIFTFTCIIVFQTSRIVLRTRELNEARNVLLKEVETELQTAHDMQMALMPSESPDVKGWQLAGRCIPANHVGGDFFQYFEQNSKLSVGLADVTGHGMEAAIPVVMFSGILDNQMEDAIPIEQRFSKLNRSLYRNLDSRTFVCFLMGEINIETRVLCLSNGGCPYPYYFKALTGEVSELQVDAYPLGIRADTEYEVVEVQLQIGDRIVFCSDGIIEAENVDGDVFGYERTADTVQKACIERLSAEVTIDRILEAVGAFKGNASQGDDMTCVVIQVE